MTFTTNEIWLALPEIYLTTALCVVLLFDLFFATKNPGPRPHSRCWCWWWAPCWPRAG
jgi:hypothetical protein